MGGRRRNHAGVASAASCLELASLGEGPGSVSTASVCSAFSYLDGEAEDIQVDEFERRLDSLFEKRGSTREKALESLAVMLRVDYRGNDCISHNETITSRCMQALKRGSAMESSLASQLLGLHILTLGQPDDSLFQSLRPELERAARGANGAAASVQAAAIDTLALAAFVLAEDEEETREVMNRLRGFWAKGDAKVRAAAVRGWSFLLTSLDGSLRDEEAVSCLAVLASMMTSAEREPDLRMAAGEAAAVLRSCCGERVLEMLVEEDEEAADGEDAAHAEPDATAEAPDEEAVKGGGHGRVGASKGRQGHTAGGRAGRRRSTDGSGEIGDLVERMQDLAANKGDKLRRSRRERAAQRSTFRGLLAAMNGEAIPECRIKLQHGDCLTVEGVAATHRLSYLRRFLAGGFQAHLQHNPLLHDVFGFRPRTERPERMSAVEKRLNRSCHSADSKARTADRRWNRDAKATRLEFGF